MLLCTKGGLSGWFLPHGELGELGDFFLSRRLRRLRRFYIASRGTRGVLKYK